MHSLLLLDKYIFVEIWRVVNIINIFIDVKVIINLNRDRQPRTNRKIHLKIPAQITEQPVKNLQLAKSLRATKKIDNRIANHNSTNTKKESEHNKWNTDIEFNKKNKKCIGSVERKRIASYRTRFLKRIKYCRERKRKSYETFED